jgi:subtilisin-like proprotein convertase family protein
VLPDAYAETGSFLYDRLGNPTTAEITIDSSTTFFVDPSPLDNSEYAPSGYPSHFTAINGGAVNAVDLLSVVLHEVGHALGFALGSSPLPPSVNDRLISRLTFGPGDTANYRGETFTEYFKLTSGTHLDAAYDLMRDSGFGSSERALPSPRDLAALNDAFDYANTSIHTYGFGPAAIPDLTTTSFFLNVQADYVITDLDVALYVQHGWDTDLDIALISPQGTRVELSTDNGGSGDNYGLYELWTRFDDEGRFPVRGDAAPFWGSYAPEGQLSLLDGERTFGTWILEIVDDESGIAGTLRDFTVIFTAAMPEAPADFDNDGEVDGDDLMVWEGAYGVNAFSDADIDGDSDGADFLEWQRQFGTGMSTHPARGNVPEPEGWLLFLAIAGMIAGNRLRRPQTVGESSQPSAQAYYPTVCDDGRLIALPNGEMLRMSHLLIDARDAPEIDRIRHTST